LCGFTAWKGHIYYDIGFQESIVETRPLPFSDFPIFLHILCQLGPDINSNYYKIQLACCKFRLNAEKFSQSGFMGVVRIETGESREIGMEKLPL
jgi:hypothetical protein